MVARTRLAAQRLESRQPHTNDDVLQADSAVAESDVFPPAKKLRRQDAGTSKRRRHGKPVELCQLNLDVLFLIAAYIHPLDLLNLARTCKSLRELLMNESSAFVWKTAFHQVKGLPPCPTDLTEPEYANLVFYARCHGCGKHTTTVLWHVRHRYCPGCRIRRLRCLSSCSEIIRKNNVLPAEYITVKKGASMRVDRDQAALFMDEYHKVSDKKQFISDKQMQRRMVLQHAKRCEDWQQKRDLEHKQDRKEILRRRSESIFRRLREHYPQEIGYFNLITIQRSRESDFRTSKPLTDKEWQKIWPEWVGIMNNFRSRRLEDRVYGPRRDALVSAYNKFITQPSPDAPTFDLLPDVGDLARFRPFLDIIEAPEKISVNGTSFAPAFAELPGLVAVWKQKLYTELTELVKIPPRLSSRNASGSQVLAPSSTRTGDMNWLHLASALFQTTCAGVFTHLEIFSVSMLVRRYPNDHEDYSEDPGPISDRFGIQFFEEAPYIVHACGLDPRAATADDMDHRNARLQCLVCEGPTLVMNWKRAMWHARSCHQTSRQLPPLTRSSRWRLVSDKYINPIQSIEQSIGTPPSGLVRCQVCRPHVGDVLKNIDQFIHHLRHCHYLQLDSKKVERDNIQEGVHYIPIGVLSSQPEAVEMVEGERVTFKVFAEK